MKKTKKTPKILSLSKETIVLLTGAGTGTLVQEPSLPQSGMEACEVTTVK